MAERIQPLEHPLHVLKGVEPVGQQDHIEGLGFAARARPDHFGVGRHDPQLRKPFPGRLVQRRIQFHPHSVGWLHAGQ